MKLSKAVWLAVLLPLIGGPANASTSTSGKVQGFVLIGGTTIVLVFTNGTRGTPPSCSNSSYPSRWAFDISTTMGQAMFATLTTARATNEDVTLAGTGTCSVLGDSETISSIVTNNVQ